MGLGSSLNARDITERKASISSEPFKIRNWMCYGKCKDYQEISVSLYYFTVSSQSTTLVNKSLSTSQHFLIHSNDVSPWCHILMISSLADNPTCLYKGAPFPPTCERCHQVQAVTIRHPPLPLARQRNQPPLGSPLTECNDPDD